MSVFPHLSKKLHNFYTQVVHLVYRYSVCVCVTFQNTMKFISEIIFRILQISFHRRRRFIEQMPLSNYVSLANICKCLNAMNIMNIYEWRQIFGAWVSHIRDLVQKTSWFHNAQHPHKKNDENLISFPVYTNKHETSFIFIQRHVRLFVYLYALVRL